MLEALIIDLLSYKSDGFSLIVYATVFGYVYLYIYYESTSFTLVCM